MSIREGLGLLKKSEFARLFFAYFITFSGNAMAPIAIAFGVLELTGSTKDSAIVIAAPIAAQALVLLLGGTLADRTSRQHLMVFAEAFAAVCKFLIALLFLTGTATVASLTILAAANGVATALFIPSTTGFITQVVKREDLQGANSLLGAARSAATMIGAAMAGVLVAWAGVGLTIVIDAITYGLSAGLIATVKALPQEKSEDASLVKDLMLGWHEFISHQWLWTIVLQFSLIVASFEAVFGLLGPAITKLHMNGSVDWGIIAAGSGFGTVAGGIIALRLKAKRPMLLATLCCFFFSGLPLALSFPMSLFVITFFAFIGGVAGQIFAVLWYTTLQTEIPSHMLSRVSAYDHLGSIALAPLGIIIGGVLFEAIGGTLTLLIAASAIIIPTILVLFVPDVRNLQSFR